MSASPARIEVVRADITTLEVDVIVNAANSRLVPGGGVDGAINRAAGPDLAKAMAGLGRCPTGEAVVTPAFKLKAKHVIHTVAPVYAQHPEKDVWRLLGSCYRNALGLAHDHKAHSIAFPSLGTGVYGIPIAQACKVAITEVQAHLATKPRPHHIVFCCFSESDAALYRAALESKEGY
ncbi:MAG: O-acetyl-ADP-ribose deacetylase [Alphaproteobacteria bacterium]|nr:O-acetyl-ADP-ribose deacetylase [Alphaproteobacteria bacterium]